MKSSRIDIFTKALALVEVIQQKGKEQRASTAEDKLQKGRFVLADLIRGLPQFLRPETRRGILVEVQKMNESPLENPVDTSITPEQYETYKANYNRTVELVISQKDPERLFIRSTKHNYGRDEKWRDRIEDTIDFSLRNIDSVPSFRALDRFVAKNYNQYFTEGVEQLPLKRFLVRNGLLPDIETILKINRCESGIPRRHPTVPIITLLGESGKALYEDVDKLPLEEIKIKNGGFTMADCRGVVIRENINGEEIPLTSILLYGKLIKGDLPALLHTKVRYLPKIYDRLEQLFEEHKVLRFGIHSGLIEKNEQTLDYVSQLVGEMHNLSAQATGYFRASAGIADADSKILFGSLGIDASRYKVGVAPDLKALIPIREGGRIISIQEYKTEYRTYFENGLRWVL